MVKHESDVVLKFKMDGQVQYAQTIKEINQTMNTAAKEYKAHVSAMGSDATATEKLTAEKKKLSIQVEGAEKRTKMLREEYEKSVKATGENSKESKKLYDQLLQSETAENNLKNSLEKTNDALKEQGDVSISTAEKLAKIEEAGEKVKGVGTKMSVGLTAPILAIGTASIAAFKDVDDSLDGITTATGATGDQLDSLQDSFKNVVNTIPAEMEDIGTGIGEVNTQFGLMNDELESMTERMLKFAEINDSDVSQSTINAKKSMDLFRLSVEDVPMILDVVSKTSQDTGVSVDQLFDAVNRGAPQLKAMGMSFAESTTLIGQMEKSGIESSTTLSYLAKASVVYAKDNKTMQEGLNEKIASIKGATTEQEKLTIASEVFGTKAASKMVEAIDSGSLSMDGFSDAAKNAAGTVDQTFTDILDPIDQAKLAQNQMKLGMGELGEQVQIALLPTFNAASETIKKVTEWFRGLSDEQKQTIIKVAGIVAAIGPMLVVFGTLMGSMTKIVTAFKLLASAIGIITSPISLVILAILALIAIFATLWMKCEWFRNFWKEMWEFVKSYFDGIITIILGIFETFISTGLAYFTAFKDLIIGVLTGIIDFVTGVFTGNWEKAWNGIVNIFSSIVNGLANAFKIPLNFIIGLLNNFISGLNKIKIPKWVPKLGGKGIDIPMIPKLAKGGNLLNGQAIVGEAGPELLTQKGNKTTVTPLNEQEKRNGVGGAMKGNTTVNQTVNISKIDANNPSELARANRQLYHASRVALAGIGGV